MFDRASLKLGLDKAVLQSMSGRDSNVSGVRILFVLTWGSVLLLLNFLSELSHSCFVYREHNYSVRRGIFRVERCLVLLSALCSAYVASELTDLKIFPKQKCFTIFQGPLYCDITVGFIKLFSYSKLPVPNTGFVL